VGNVRNKTLLHLQCHFGADSLDWARRGAEVTGADLSDAAIDEARKLNAELSLNAKFICCNVYDLKNHLHHPFENEFMNLPYPCFRNIVEAEKGKWHKGLEGKLTMVYSVRAVKQ